MTSTKSFVLFVTTMITTAALIMTLIATTTNLTEDDTMGGIVGVLVGLFSICVAFGVVIKTEPRR